MEEEVINSPEVAEEVLEVIDTPEAQDIPEGVEDVLEDILNVEEAIEELKEEVAV